MKLIEPSIKKVEKGPIQGYIDQAKQWLPIGKPSTEFEDLVIEHFLRGLDNQYFMLHNLQLEALNPPFPPILIGPAGLAVLNISPEKGFFKAKESSWWKMDKTTHRFNPGRPNLIKQTLEFARKLTTILDVHGKSHPEVLPILIFANPGVHIEATNPAIRIVLMDGIDNLIAAFRNSEEILSPNEINYLSDSLEVISNPEKALPMGEGEDFFGRDLFVPEKKAPPKLPTIPISMDVKLPPVEKKLQFNKKQWIILTVLLLFTIVVLLAAIFYALSAV
jgi:hypothetical protein